ncbi:MAG: M23 family metallopeptidase [Deltaproteobacteria bacterium]|nr:M23 family metallopeptidase [Deltaproteobacteria bacterium]
MKIAESYSVIVIPKDRAHVKRWVISRERVVAVLSAVAGFAVFTTVICYGLLHYRQEYLATEDLRQRGRQYEKERVRVLARLGELEDVVNQNEQLASKLETIVGINTTGQGVQVGMNGDGKEFSRPSSLKLASVDPNAMQNTADVFDETSLKAFDLKAIDLGEEAKDIGKRLKEVYRFNPDTAYFWTAVPTVWPIRGWVTSNFGSRRSPMTGGRQFHEGIDIASPYGSPVTATGDGVVTFAGRQGGLGNKVIVDHGYGLVTVYGHNSKLMVKEGAHVTRGTIIAQIGSTGRSTGPHVHYEVLVNGVPVDPVRYILEQL